MNDRARPPNLPLRPDGSVTVRRVGVPRDVGRDFYHFLRIASWPTLLGSIALTFVAANGVFALLYLAGGDTISHARAGSFEDAFFFSVQTMATIGYGGMTPVGTYANLLATAEAAFGLILTAMSTGIVFAKFASPNPRVVFTRYAVIAPENGVPTLMFRMANERTSHIIVEAQVRVTLIRDVAVENGVVTRRLTDLPLLRERTPLFALTWTAYHPIDAASPLHDATAESLKRDNAAVLVTFTGIDDTLAQTVHARHAYTWDRIVIGGRLADVFLQDEEGQRYIDHRRFHELIRPDAATPPEP